MVDYKVQNVVNPIPMENIRFGGAIAKQAETFFRERIRSDYARSEVYGETEKQFSIRNDDEFPVGFWRGEFWGKWVISACRVARYENDESLKVFLNKAAHNLIKTADPDGYIGSYRDPRNVFPCDPEESLKAVGYRSIFNWNVWCRKYTLWGMLEVYELTGDQEILEACMKSMDQLIAMFREMGIKTRDCGTFNGLPAGSIMKPMLILYRITADKKYLDFALEIADDWERDDGKVPNVIANARSMRPVHTWYEGPRFWAKAYEMMSCFDGILELYRITGIKRYLEAAENMYTLLWEHEQNTLFSVGFNDLFVHGSAYANAISEPCDVIHWMRLCSELYYLTGNAKYMHTFEYSFYNPFLASSFQDGKWGARGVRSMGRHMVTHGKVEMQHNHCCVTNIPRGFINAAECYVLQKADGLVINHYTDFTAKTRFGVVLIGGSYLRDGKVTVTVLADKALSLSLRIPAFSDHTILNGKAISAVDGYYELEIPTGETVLELQFEMLVKLREMAEPTEHFPSDDFRIRRYVMDNPVQEADMTWDCRATVVYGPLLLTRSKLVGNTEDEMFHSDTVANKGYRCSVEPIESQAVSCAFRVTFRNGDDVVTTHMCDYGSGTNIESPDDDRLFNIFV